MSVDSKTIQRIAKLARLNITDDKYDLYADELSKIIKVIDQLAQVDTTDLDPVVNVNNRTIVLRKDVVTEGNCDEEILSNAPKSKFGYFLVPKMVE